MGKNLLFLYLFFAPALFFGQSIKLSGNCNDTLAKQPLPNVLMMAVKFTDSTLVGSARSNSDGVFRPLRLPLDTYIVILSHPNFSDKTYLLVPSPKDTAFNFKNVVLPPKSIVLNEVEIIAYREKSYYKGDTLIFTADSFKTRPNATVEDLLKKLPGVRVDAKGKITIQGKEVDQVLVDGDEFFGSDPTIATRNLNASSVENVQVYDKKNESTEEGKSETLKVVNLKLKEDAKKGYFGKVSGASDFNRFYENELLFNKFKGNQKVSVFGLLANTPKQAFDWNEINKYGLTGEQQWNYDEEANSWTSTSESKTGVPQTIKSGFYFNDKLGKNTKLNIDYTFNQNQLNVGKETNTQYFLQDTSYSNTTVNNSKSFNQNHAFNMRLVQKLDSLTELTLVPKLKYTVSQNNSFQQDDFISKNNELTRRTEITNTNSGENSALDLQIKLKRSFMKKDRSVTFIYQPIYNSGYSSTQLNTDFIYFKNQERDSSLRQKRKQTNYKMEHNASLTYVEPLTKKFKTELSYNFSQSLSNNTRNTYDNGSGSDIFNSPLSNSFENQRVVQRAGAKLIYDVKKYRVSVGGSFRNIYQENLNLSTRQNLALNVNNVLPNASFNYRISQGSNLTVQYNGNSQQPDVRQMQPVIDNSDPNRISIGNPNLKPTYSNNVSVNYYFFKAISDINLYSGANASNTYNQLSNTTTYNSDGKAVTQPINVNGNYNGSMYLGGGFPVFKRYMKIYYQLNANLSNNVSYVNGNKTNSQTTGLGPSLTFEKSTDAFEVNIQGEYEYNVPKTNVSSLSNQPYYTYGVNGNILLKFPKKFSLGTNGNYTNNGNRASGYNLNYFIVNATVSKTFLKSENLVVSFEANDIFNQNINNQRYITGNQIVDSKTNIIKRYFLLKVLLKLNSQKTKGEGDDD